MDPSPEFSSRPAQQRVKWLDFFPEEMGVERMHVAQQFQKFYYYRDRAKRGGLNS